MTSRWQERLRAERNYYEEEWGKLEEERVKLKKRLHTKALDQGRRAALLDLSVEKLAALEEIDAQLDEDYDFEGERVGAARLLPRSQPPPPPPGTGDATLGGYTGDASVLTLEFASMSDVKLLQKRGSQVQAEVRSLQAELAKKVSELQASDAARRSAERHKSSLVQVHVT